MRLLFFVFIVLFGDCVFAQDVEEMDSLLLFYQLDSLKSDLGHGKTVPDRYALSFYTALSYFPELDSSQITFKRARIKTTLNARPTALSLLFRSRDKRKYVIRINSKKRDSLILLDDVPFNARVGLFGHELTHFSDYHHRSFFGVIHRLFSYATLKGKERFEKEIDSRTVSVGLGWQLHAWSYYVLYQSRGSAKYKDYKRQVYLEPEEILRMIRQ